MPAPPPTPVSPRCSVLTTHPARANVLFRAYLDARGGLDFLSVSVIDEHWIDGVPVRVTNVAKTIADCFKYRNKLGRDVALEALKEARGHDGHDRRVSIDELWCYARLARVANVMRPYLEALA